MCESTSASDSFRPYSNCLWARPKSTLSLAKRALLQSQPFGDDRSTAWRHRLQAIDRVRLARSIRALGCASLCDQENRIDLVRDQEQCSRRYPNYPRGSVLDAQAQFQLALHRVRQQIAPIVLTKKLRQNLASELLQVFSSACSCQHRSRRQPQQLLPSKYQYPLIAKRARLQTSSQAPCTAGWEQHPSLRFIPRRISTRTSTCIPS